MKKMMRQYSHISFFTVVLSFLVSSTIAAYFNTTTTDQQQARNLNIEGKEKYVVKTCLADGIGKPCTGDTSLKKVDLRNIRQEAEDSCEAREHMKGSVTYADLILPTVSSPSEVLLVEVETKVSGQDSRQGFFVRPTRLTRYWGKANVSKKKASFYLADTGQVRNQVTNHRTKNYSNVLCHQSLSNRKMKFCTLTLSTL
jgi:hypothetical protein